MLLLRYFSHNFLQFMLLSFILLIISLPSHAKINQKIVQSLDSKSFDTLWSQYCLDLGEHPLKSYFLNNAEIKKQGGVPTHVLRVGQLFIVSDNFSSLGTKCYRDSNLHRVIIKKSTPYPVVFTNSEIDRLPPSRIIYEHIYYAYRDFLTSNINNKIYATVYSTRDKMVNKQEQGGVYFLFFNDNRDNKIAFKYDGYIGIYLYQLYRISKDTYKSKLIDKKGVSDDNFYLPGELQYKFISNDLLTKKKGEEKYYFSDYVNNKPAVLSPSNDLSMQIAYTSSSNNQEKNIEELTSKLSKTLNRFLNLPASNKVSHLKERKKWLLNWIDQYGYITTESGKRLKTNNRKRLQTWLTRYLSKYNVKLIKGKTYYFSRDLSHYMIMDYYKSDGYPISKAKIVNPCLYYMKYNKDICNY